MRTFYANKSALIAVFFLLTSATTSSLAHGARETAGGQFPAQNLTIAHSPSIPPGPDDGVRVAHSPSIPPGPDDGVGLTA